MKESSSYKWIVLGNIMIGTFMAVLDSTVVNTGLPVIMGTLGADINVAEWVLTGYMLSMASILPAAGWLSERFGYKKIYFLSLLVFTAGSFMCGSSSTIEELIFWRVIEGFGCGMLLPVGMAIVSDVFPPEQRGTALGFWSIASAASVSFGPAIGGYLVDYMDWNYIFYVNIPIGILALIVTAIVQKEHVKGTGVPFDIPGFITSAIFLPVFMYGLSEVNSSTNSMGMEQSRSTWCHVDCSGHFYSFPLFRVYRQNTADQSAPVCRQGLCVVQPDSVCFWYRHVRQYVFDSALFTGQSGLFGFAGRYVFHASGDYPGSGFSFVRQTDATDQPQGLYRVGNPVDGFEFLYVFHMEKNRTKRKQAKIESTVINT